MEGDNGTSGETDYIPIRVLGRGAFGEAVLYRKLEDNSLVVWKEIDLRRLSVKERRDAQNEIDILAMLNHANIVSYYNHFLDGETLLIEMEYCNGGNLHEKILAQKELFPEEVVLWYFYQVAAAIAHIHEYGILHRDVKTLNIFLTKSALVKLGDFGISKVMDTKSQMAESYVGTPYYMSPELIRGDQYNQKSDIWATGCVLYELLTLSKVFDATNPLKLANEIVCSEFQDIDPRYSKDIRTLVYDMLNKEAEQRPTAENVLKYPVFEKVSSGIERKIWELNSATRRTKMSTYSGSDVLPVVTSKASEVYLWGGGKLTPQKIEIFTKGRSALQVSIGHSHFAVVTVEKELYTWASAQFGAEIVGQLGHGDTAAYKAPKKVDDFEGIAIKEASCGEDFTLCVTDEGAVYAFGSDYYGCLGCDNAEGEEVCTPVLLDYFSSRPVDQVSCGDAHVVALTRNGDVYTWGCGEFGRLGLGSEDDHALPQKVKTRGRHAIRSVHAGPDGTFLVKTNSRVLACGSNEFNKLGFNSAAHGLRKRKEQSYDIPCKYTPTTVKPLSKHQIITVSAGRTHSAAIDCYGHLITFGSNRYGQLGVGDFKERTGVHMIGGVLAGQWVTKVACGDNYTVVSTADNQIYSWGTSENGRLGITGDQGGRGPGGVCFSLPRPTFGSLHVVSDLTCKHWHTLMVADKVLAQKTIRSSTSVTKAGVTEESQLPTDSESVFTDSTSEAGSTDQASSAAASMGESTMPVWLKQELADSEFIPVSGSDEKSDGASSQDSGKAANKGMDSSVPPWLREELKSAEFIPVKGQKSDSLCSQCGRSQADKPSQSQTNNKSSAANSSVLDQSANQSQPSSQSHDSQQSDLLSQLQEKLQKMETENQKLQELVDHQTTTIHTQANTIIHLEDQNAKQLEVQEDIWTLVDTWQQDCKVAMGNDNVVTVTTTTTNTSIGNHGNHGNHGTGNNNNSAPSSPHYNSSTPSSPRCNGVGAEDRMTQSMIDWGSLTSPTGGKAWSKSNRRDMMKSFTPSTIAKVLRGVTTSEQIV